MTQEEYKSMRKEIREQQAKLEDALDIAYARENNPYKVGDIVEDQIGVLLIEKIIYHTTYDYNRELPYCTYKGTELTKKLVPKKKQDFYREAFQKNIRRKIGEQLSVKPE